MAPEREPDGKMRLNKFLAHAGFGSRRAAEELIQAGRVSVDGEVVREMGLRLDPETAKVDVDGETVKLQKAVYYAVHKPKGHVSTNSDPSGRPRVVDLLPNINERVYPVGRLDEDSTGLILLTNDGELANRLAHPRYGVEKVYKALVAGRPHPSILDRLVEGVWLSDGKARARRARFAGVQGDSTYIELTLAEGKNREVRRMLAKLGHKVMSLTRVAVGPIRLKGLAMGEWRHLTQEEVGLLHRVAAGEALPTRDRGPRRGDRPGPLGGMNELLEGDRREGSGGPRRRFQNNGPPRMRERREGGPPPRRPRPVDEASQEGERRPPRRPMGDEGGEGARPPRRTAKPGLYEPKSFKRAGREENEPEEILVSPLGDGPGDRPGRRPPRPQGPAGPPRGRGGPGGPPRGQMGQAPPRRPASNEPPPLRGRKIVGLGSAGEGEGEGKPRYRRAVGPAREEQGPPPRPRQLGPKPRRPKPLPPRRRPGRADESED